MKWTEKGVRSLIILQSTSRYPRRKGGKTQVLFVNAKTYSNYIQYIVIHIISHKILRVDNHFNDNEKTQNKVLISPMDII